MPSLDYKDFYFRKPSILKKGRVAAIQPTKKAFLKKIDSFLKKDGKKLVTIETMENYFRIWYIN